ncbi:MAG TPA: sensor histidine kinase, partial [Desulfuromonadaceae bacterium]|nr:sensor histidine kinase [Desulfuromonadaceae bacterium]
FFWQTWWFRLTAVAVFTSLVFVLARYISFRRLRLKLRAAEQEAALHKERARIARDLHDDLGTGLTGIVLLSGLALRDRDHPQKAAVRAQEILTKARQVIKSLDEIVWAVNPTNDTAADLIDYISQFAVEFLQPAGIQCRVDLVNELPERTISSETRHNLFLIVKECLNNIIRHAGATQVRLRFTVTEQALGVTIEDDGQGFTGGRPGGDGLGNMKQRVTSLNGDLEIRSEPGKGTQVSLRVPWPKEKSKR